MAPPQAEKRHADLTLGICAMQARRIRYARMQKSV